MKNMRWPGKSSNKQQAGSQLWLETLTEMKKKKKKPSAEIRIPNALESNDVNPHVHYRQEQVPTGEKGSDAKHLFQ